MALDKHLFKYRDKEGYEHDVIAICSYTITGVVTKTRDLKQVVTALLARQQAVPARGEGVAKMLKIFRSGRASGRFPRGIIGA